MFLFVKKLPPRGGSLLILGRTIILFLPAPDYNGNFARPAYADLKFSGMPYYIITITIRPRTDGKSDETIVAYRQYPETDIDKIWHMLHVKCQEKYGHSLKSFECLSFSKRSPHYQAFLRQEKQNQSSKKDDPDIS